MREHKQKCLQPSAAAGEGGRASVRRIATPIAAQTRNRIVMAPML
jgi:hypothetical protein